MKKGKRNNTEKLKKLLTEMLELSREAYEKLVEKMLSNILASVLCRERVRKMFETSLISALTNEKAKILIEKEKEVSKEMGIYLTNIKEILEGVKKLKYTTNIKRFLNEAERYIKQVNGVSEIRKILATTLAEEEYGDTLKKISNATAILEAQKINTERERLNEDIADLSKYSSEEMARIVKEIESFWGKEQ